MIFVNMNLMRVTCFKQVVTSIIKLGKLWNDQKMQGSVVTGDINTIRNGGGASSKGSVVHMQGWGENTIHSKHSLFPNDCILS